MAMFCTKFECQEKSEGGAWIRLYSEFALDIDHELLH